MHHFALSKKLGLDFSAAWSYQSGRRGTVPYGITYGQSIYEFVGRYPVVAYGEVLFYIENWTTVLGDIGIDTRLGSPAGDVQPFHSFRNINDFKLPDSHHLDVNANLSIKYRLGESVIGLGIYNVYNHYNVSNVYIGYRDNKAVLKGICPFPLMPSISFTQKF